MYWEGKREMNRKAKTPARPKNRPSKPAPTPTRGTPVKRTVAARPSKPVARPPKKRPPVASVPPPKAMAVAEIPRPAAKVKAGAARPPKPAAAAAGRAPKAVAPPATAKAAAPTGRTGKAADAAATGSSAAYRGERRKRYETLVEMREQLTQTVRTLSNASLTSTRQPGEELADVGSDNFTREMGLALMTEDGHQLALIEEALERLDQGTYGKCIDCGGRISPLRLDAIPYAKLCVDCKGKREHMEAERMPEPTAEDLSQQDEITE